MRMRDERSREQRLDLAEPEAVRLGHEHGQLARVERVAVERDVDGVGAFERTLDRALARLDARRLDELDLGRIEIAGADEGDVAREHGAVVDHHPQRHPPRVPGRRGLRRVQVAVRVEPDDGEAFLAGGEPLDRTDVRAAAAAEHDRAVGQLAGEQEVLLRERVRLDHARLGIGQLQVRRLGHRLAAVAPGARDADEAGEELAAAGVALVLRADRDGGQRAAVRTAGAQAAHACSS